MIKNNLSIGKKKENLRKRMLAERRALSVENLSNMSISLTGNIQQLASYKSAQKIMTFLAMEGESNLDMLIKDALKLGKEMEAGRVKDMSHFEIGTLGLRCLKKGYETLVPEKLDLVLIPAVACDIFGRRLGMGAGYYDRYLERIPYEKRIAVVWDFQVQEEPIPTEPFDMGVSSIVTEKRIIKIMR